MVAREKKTFFFFNVIFLKYQNLNVKLGTAVDVKNAYIQIELAVSVHTHAERVLSYHLIYVP